MSRYNNNTDSMRRRVARENRYSPERMSLVVAAQAAEARKRAKPRLERESLADFESRGGKITEVAEATEDAQDDRRKTWHHAQKKRRLPRRLGGKPNG